MNKKLKMISFLLSAAMSSGLMINSLPVYAANVDVNQLYNTAFTAIENALSTKTQKSINDARAAIDALLGTDASWAIGEFSKQVDSVQQPILVRAVDAINKAQLSGKQADINAAKAAIDQDLPTGWKGSYSSAVDVIEQKLMKSALAALDKATTSKSQADIDAANAIINEIKTSADVSIVDWTKDISTQLPSSGTTGSGTTGGGTTGGGTTGGGTTSGGTTGGGTTDDGSSSDDSETPVTPAAPTVTRDDTANTVSGMSAGMEYSLDGAAYVAYNATTFNAIDLSGTHTLLVRVAASGINPAGPATALTFTTNTAPSSAVTISVSSVSVVNGKVTIQGTISSGSGKNVTLKVLNSLGELDYINQVASGDGGAFTFVYTTNNAAGKNCVAYIGGEGVTTPCQEPFVIK